MQNYGRILRERFTRNMSVCVYVENTAMCSSQENEHMLTTLPTRKRLFLIGNMQEEREKEEEEIALEKGF